ncbi:hypothetical protein FJZ39_03900 [Candidatus Saccharibacteria bacterium]|nr:hypothetical protein [Candidatus Saccharibacteria bacterium]
MPFPATTNADYFTFNVHSSLLLVGQTGSGKTELVQRYIKRLERAFTPEQMQYILYDLKQVGIGTKDGGGAKAEYLYTPVRTGKPEYVDYLEELADLAQARAEGKEPKDKLLFIYIEECDLAVQYPERFHAAVMTINKYARMANMKLVFSTSSPRRDVIPPDFRDSFELILSGPLAGKFDEETLGVSDTQSIMFPYEFIVKEVKAG